MNNRLLTIALATACGSAMISAGAFAQQTAASQAGQSASVSAQSNAMAPSAQRDTSTNHTQRAVPAPGSRMCVRDTGSHIQPPKGQCLPVNGNSYSRQDIRRTGAINVGQALQMLDPSVQVSGGH